jgi:hypothetical protein
MCGGWTGFFVKPAFDGGIELFQTAQLYKPTEDTAGSLA